MYESEHDYNFFLETKSSARSLKFFNFSMCIECKKEQDSVVEEFERYAKNILIEILVNYKLLIWFTEVLKPCQKSSLKTLKFHSSTDQYAIS